VVRGGGLGGGGCGEREGGGVCGRGGGVMCWGVVGPQTAP